MRYFFEDLTAGTTLTAGPHQISEDEIVAFACIYDPQYFHTDPEAARGSTFGGLVASGWQTASIAHSLLVDALGPDSGSMGSPGMDELRWLVPVRPGDELTMRWTVLDATPSRSKKDRGSVRAETLLVNQKNEIVMRMIGIGIFKRRSDETAHSRV